MPRPPEPGPEHVRLADFIVDWLVSRNRGELDEVFGNMRRRDYENLKEELELILACGGKPPNWV